MHDAVPAIAACGVSPIVRIPDNQGFMVKRALDPGAHGVLVPLLYTVEDAKKLVFSKVPSTRPKRIWYVYFPARTSPLNQAIEVPEWFNSLISPRAISISLMIYENCSGLAYWQSIRLTLRRLAISTREISSQPRSHGLSPTSQ